MKPSLPLEASEKEISKILEKINALKNLSDWNDLKLSLLEGKNNRIKEFMALLKELPEKEKKVWGPKVNLWKKEIEQRLTAKKSLLLESEDEKEPFDVTLPVKRAKIGHLAPETQVIRKMNSFFTYHGFSVAEGPDIETDEFNFEKTNLPKDHPARDLQDTIYIEPPEILLRTHTSSVETRILSSSPPPLRFVVPGVSFRNEILSPSNHAVFYQYQGVLVDKEVSLANLKGLLVEFARFMFGAEVKTRFRTKYYPEVEPGAGLDILCKFCSGDGCSICKGRGWMEILGSGLIHRELLKKCGLDYRVWGGFAFGMGLDRILMSYLNINDIRELRGGSLVFAD